MKGYTRVCAALAAVFMALLPLRAAGEGECCFSNDAEHHVYACGDSAGKRVALTFDDGPHPVYTDRILKILDDYGVRATFFVIGQNAGLYPEVLDRIAAAGHEIGCHTYTHPHLAGLSEAALTAEIEKTLRVLDSHGIKASRFRPPEGYCGKTVISAAGKTGLDVILWSVDTSDWRCPGVNAIVKTVKTTLDGGGIILMHDYVSGKSGTPEALEILLPWLLSEGYEPVTVGELLA